MLLTGSSAGPFAQAGVLQIARGLLLLLHCLDLVSHMRNHYHSSFTIIFPPILHKISWHHHKI